MFRHEPDDDNGIFLLNALYAPAYSNEYLEWENKTSRELFKVMPKNVKFWWNDLYPLSPNKNPEVTPNYFFPGIVTTYILFSSKVDQKAMEKFITSDEESPERDLLLSNWKYRMIEYVNVTDSPVLVFVGKTTNLAYFRLPNFLGDEIISFNVTEDGICELTVKKFAFVNIDGTFKVVHVVFGVDHPSYFLMLGKKDLIVNLRYKFTWSVVTEIMRNLKEDIDEKLLLDSRLKNKDLDVAALLHAITILGIPVDKKGLLLEEYKYLRFESWTDTEILDSYISRKNELGNEEFLKSISKKKMYVNDFNVYSFQLTHEHVSLSSLGNVSMDE